MSAISDYYAAIHKDPDQFHTEVYVAGVAAAARADKAETENVRLRDANTVLLMKLKRYEPVNTYDGRDIDSWRKEAEDMREALTTLIIEIVKLTSKA